MENTLTYILDSENNILNTNLAFADFANENGAPNLENKVSGKSIWQYITDANVQELYGAIFEAVRSTEQSVSINFRCDSPDLLRFMRMDIQPLEKSNLEISTILIREITRARALKREIFYLGINHGIPMCSQCNKIYINKDESWVETDMALENNMISDELTVKFTICKHCIEKLNSKAENLMSLK